MCVFAAGTTIRKHSRTSVHMDWQKSFYFYETGQVHHRYRRRIDTKNQYNTRLCFGIRNGRNRQIENRSNTEMANIITEKKYKSITA